MFKALQDKLYNTKSHLSLEKLLKNTLEDHLFIMEVKIVTSVCLLEQF